MDFRTFYKYNLWNVSENKGPHNHLYWNVYSININNHVTEVVWARWLVDLCAATMSETAMVGSLIKKIYWGIAIGKDFLNREASMWDIHHELFEIGLDQFNISSHTVDCR